MVHPELKDCVEGRWARWSPTVYTPLVGAQVSLAGSGRLSLPTEPGWEMRCW